LKKLLEIRQGNDFYYENAEIIYGSKWLDPTLPERFLDPRYYDF
jgi:hypothetical protein